MTDGGLIKDGQHCGNRSPDTMNRPAEGCMTGAAFEATQ